MAPIALPALMRTFVANGIHLDSIRRDTSNCTTLKVHKIELWGARINYLILFAPQRISSAITSRFLKEAKFASAHPVGIGDTQSDRFLWFTPEQVMQTFGGVVDSQIIRNPDLPRILDTLGHNRLPRGLVGDPDELLEIHVTECLRFLMASQARRYGSDRQFESLPDGISLRVDGPNVQFDSKAYSGGYSVSADDIRRYESYVNEFNKKYGGNLGKVFSFLVISGRFKQSIGALRKRSENLYARCATPLSFISAKELGQITQSLMREPKLRNAIDWKVVFAATKIESSRVMSQIRRIKKDKVL